MTDRPVLPEGQDRFKINEVCKLANVQPYMLRFWGTEFAQLEAARSGTGQRSYTREQVELILEIRHLLFDEGLTIAGARKRIERQAEESAPAASKAKKPPKMSPKTAPAEQPSKVDIQKEVDKATAEIVQPLLATLRDIREELTNMADELKASSG